MFDKINNLPKKPESVILNTVTILYPDTYKEMQIQSELNQEQVNYFVGLLRPFAINKLPLIEYQGLGSGPLGRYIEKIRIPGGSALKEISLIKNQLAKNLEILQINQEVIMEEINQATNKKDLQKSFDECLETMTEAYNKILEIEKNTIQSLV